MKWNCIFKVITNPSFILFQVKNIIFLLILCKENKMNFIHYFILLMIIVGYSKALPLKQKTPLSIIVYSKLPIFRSNKIVNHMSDERLKYIEALNQMIENKGIYIKFLNQLIFINYLFSQLRFIGPYL